MYFVFISLVPMSYVAWTTIPLRPDGSDVQTNQLLHIIYVQMN